MARKPQFSFFGTEAVLPGWVYVLFCLLSGRFCGFSNPAVSHSLQSFLYKLCLFVVFLLVIAGFIIKEVCNEIQQNLTGANRPQTE